MQGTEVRSNLGMTNENDDNVEAVDVTAATGVIDVLDREPDTVGGEDDGDEPDTVGGEDDEDEEDTVGGEDE